MIVIIPHTRQFNIPGADLTFGVVSDNDSERKYFQCPRYVGDNLDIAGSFVRINYRNANGEIDSYLVDDLVVDGDNVKFSWLLSQNVTEYKGQVKFVMCVVGPDLKLKWHTTQGTGNVYDGLEPDSAVVESETLDVVAQLIAMVEAQTTAVEEVGEKWVANVNAEGATQVAAVKAAAEDAEAASVAEIEAKGVNTLASIPEDYTALSATVDELVRGKAPGIVCSAEGEAITVSDASATPLSGLRIFGKSTQDGTPTPDAPVEIVSVENPVVMVAGKNLLPTNDSIELIPGGSNYVPIVSSPIYLTGGTYTFSFDITQGGTSCSRNTPQFTNTETLDVYYGTVATNDNLSAGRHKHIIDIPKGIYNVLWWCNKLETAQTVSAMQLEFGSIETKYEQYKSTKTVELAHTLPGIPVTSGGNYTDDNGQEWVCDEVDLERGVYVQRVKKVVYNGGESWTKSGTSITCYLRTPEALQEQPMCDRLGPRAEDGAPYIRMGTTGDGITALIVSFGQIEPNTVDAFKATLTEHPLNVQYALINPIETPLSDPEIAAYRALHTNCPNTTILNDGGAHMVVKYVADTKRYIDNKIAALVSGV